MKMYEKKNFPRTIHDFNKMNTESKLTFDNAVQRGLTWDNDRKSLLIHSMIIDFPVPPMYCNCIFSDPKNKTYDFIDGKQRTLGALIPFYNDEFVLTNVPIINIDEDSENDDDADPEKLIDINGMKYSNLPREFQDKIRQYSFTVYYYENMAQDDVEEMFMRLNNGKSLTAVELSRAKAKSSSIIKSIGKHELFKIALSEKSINGYANEDIVIKSWALLYKENPSYETKYIRPLWRDAEISEDQEQTINKVFCYIKSVHEHIKSEDDKELNKVAKRILMKTHLLSLVPVAAMALQNAVDSADFSKWVLEFFGPKKTTSISETYNSTLKSETGSSSSVNKRINAIKENYSHRFNN